MNDYLIAQLVTIIIYYAGSSFYTLVATMSR